MPDIDRDEPSEEFVSRIAAELQREPRHRGGLHLAAFLTVEKKVTKALEHGFPMKTVWRQLRKDGAVQMAYETFRDYCRSAELRRQPRLARRRKVKHRLSDGMPPRVFKHNSVPDESKLY